MKTLVFNEGTIRFPNPYESMGFELNGVKLPLLAEEMLYKYSPYYFNKYKDNKSFIKNVWTDLKPQLPKELQKLSFPKDFESLFVSMDKKRTELKLQKSAYDKLHKKTEEEKFAEKEKFGYCYKDGIKIELANTMVEQSRWFISRGKLCGRWVSSVMPEDVEVNTSNKKYPCIPNHSWKSIILKDTDFIASYKINIGFGESFVPKTISISANSEEKQDDVKEKYDHAIALTKIWDKTYKKIIKDLSSTDYLIQENAMISYIIFTYGIRIGNEKGENDIRDKTYGASTLLKKHITVNGDKVTLKFSGKDSVLFNGTKKCHKDFVSALNDKLATKYEDTQVFSKASSITVSEYLKKITKLDFVSPKLARTCLAGVTLAKELQKKENWKGLTDKEFKNEVMKCCLEVTKTLNHQKTITSEQSKKVDDTVKEKKKSAKQMLEKTKKSVEEKLLKNNNDLIKARNKNDKVKVKELKLQKTQLESKLALAKKKYDDTIKALDFKKESKSSNLGTALNSYSNPMLNFSLCKEAEKDVSLIYSKTQQKKFEWAKDVSVDFWKNYPNV